MNRFSIAKLCVTLTIAGLSVPAALAAKYAPYDAPQTVADSHLFGDIDANHDGYISRSEVPETLNDLRMHFDQYTGNHRMSKEAYGWYMRSATAPDCFGFTLTTCFSNQKSPVGFVRR